MQHHQQQQHHQHLPQQMHPQALGGMSHLLAAQQQGLSAHLMKPPMNNGMEVSPGPPSALNPNSVGNTLHPQSHNASHSSVSPPGTANNTTNPAAGNGNFFPFMLPYPYAGYGLPTPEQQAGLAELLLQQQRLNAAAAQLIGMPPQMQQQPGNGLNGLHNNQFNGSAGAIPPYSMLFPGLLGGMQNGAAQQQLYQNYQQQYGSFAAGGQQMPQQALNHVLHGHHQQQQQHPTTMSSKATGGMYPDLDDLMKNENMPPPPQQHVQNGQYTSSSSSNGYTTAGGRTHGSYGGAHTRSDSSNGASPVSSHHYHSVSPQPPAYIPSRHHPDYNGNQQQQYNSYANSNGAAAGQQIFQKTHSSHHHGSGNTVLGKGKRGFESEADTLLNDLKKKRYDGTNGSQCKSHYLLISNAFLISDHSFARTQSNNAWIVSQATSSTRTPLSVKHIRPLFLRSPSILHNHHQIALPILQPQTSVHAAHQAALDHLLKRHWIYRSPILMILIIYYSHLDNLMNLLLLPMILLLRKILLVGLWEASRNLSSMRISPLLCRPMAIRMVNIILLRLMSISLQIRTRHPLLLLPLMLLQLNNSSNSRVIRTSIHLYLVSHPIAITSL